MCMAIHRRELLATLLGTGTLFAARELLAASDFWNRKDPAAWTSEQILQLATRSPWATQARVVPKPGRDRGSTQTLAPDVAGGRSGGRGTGPDPVVQVSEVTVVWSSAKPLIDVLKTSFPMDFTGHYVISIMELPPGLHGKPMTQDAMEASLQVKGKGSVGSGAIQLTRQAAIFGFSKDLLPISATDKEILFELTTDQYTIRARFTPKEMLYHGTLAV
jgi:hypothetical protein